MMRWPVCVCVCVCGIDAPAFQLERATSKANLQRLDSQEVGQAPKQRGGVLLLVTQAATKAMLTTAWVY
jgi:hypothetical protein